jgi:hypothetical protein
MYNAGAQANPEAGAQPNADAGAQANANDNVTDAEFEEVK